MHATLVETIHGEFLLFLELLQDSKTSEQINEAADPCRNSQFSLDYFLGLSGEGFPLIMHHHVTVIVQQNRPTSIQ